MQNASIRVSRCPARQHGPHDSRLTTVRVAMAEHPIWVNQHRIRAWVAAA